MPRATFLLGLMTLAAAWLGPLPHWAQHSFTAHMAMHMSVVAIAAPLLALGVIGTRFDPTRWRARWWAAVPASLVELVVVWAWHAPRLHHLARQTPGGLWLEQTTFLLSGLLVWLAAFSGSTEARNRARIAAGVVALLLTSMHMTLLGALLALTPRPLYAHASGFMALSPLDDQHCGGALMLLVGGVVYLAGGLWLTKELLRERLRTAGGTA